MRTLFDLVKAYAVFISENVFGYSKIRMITMMVIVTYLATFCTNLISLIFGITSYVPIFFISSGIGLVIYTLFAYLNILMGKLVDEIEYLKDRRKAK